MDFRTQLGSRAAVDQAFSRLAKEEKLLRVARGAYVAPITSRFGTRAPAPEKVLEALANQSDERSGSNPTGPGPQGLHNIGTQSQTHTRPLRNYGEARAPVDAGFGHGSGWCRGSVLGLAGACACQQITGHTAPVSCTNRVESSGIHSCHPAVMDGARYRRRNYSCLNHFCD